MMLSLHTPPVNTKVHSSCTQCPRRRIRREGEDDEHLFFASDRNQKKLKIDPALPLVTLSSNGTLVFFQDFPERCPQNESKCELGQRIHYLTHPDGCPSLPSLFATGSDGSIFKTPTVFPTRKREEETYDDFRQIFLQQSPTNLEESNLNSPRTQVLHSTPLQDCVNLMPSFDAAAGE